MLLLIHINDTSFKKLAQRFSQGGNWLLDLHDGYHSVPCNLKQTNKLLSYFQKKLAQHVTTHK